MCFYLTDFSKNQIFVEWIVILFLLIISLISDFMFVDSVLFVVMLLVSF